MVHGCGVVRFSEVFLSGVYESIEKVVFMNLCMWGGKGDVGFHVLLLRADWAILSPPFPLPV